MANPDVQESNPTTANWNDSKPSQESQLKRMSKQQIAGKTDTSAIKEELKFYTDGGYEKMLAKKKRYKFKSSMMKHGCCTNRWEVTKAIRSHRVTAVFQVKHKSVGRKS